MRSATTNNCCEQIHTSQGDSTHQRPQHLCGTHGEACVRLHAFRQRTRPGTDFIYSLFARRAQPMHTAHFNQSDCGKCSKWVQPLIPIRRNASRRPNGEDRVLRTGLQLLGASLHEVLVNVRLTRIDGLECPTLLLLERNACAWCERRKIHRCMYHRRKP